MFDARSNTPMFGFMRPKKVKILRFAFRPFFVIALASLFLFNALGGDMLIGEVWAAKSSSGLTSVGLDSTGSPSPLKSLSATTFTLPQELGIIQESTEVPGSGKTVIHIQDAHCNYAAQKSIAEILNYLTTEYGIDAVNCEGAAEGYDLSPFTAIPEKDIREKTADFFVKEGVVSAAEYYAVNNPEKVNLWGVEDPDLYLKNLKVYRDSLAHKDEIDEYIKSIEYILDNLKRHIYSNELLELDKYYTGYKEKKITFKEYLLYLINMSRKRMIDIKSFPNIYLLGQTLADEDNINFKRANNEKDEVVDRLKKSLSRNELEELIIMVGKLKAERISQADFYAYLVKKAKSVKLDISGYSELQKYIIYISLYGAIDRTKVAKEIDALEYRIKTSLYENDTQRELGVLSKNLAITKNMFNISLTRDDYIYYKEHRETFAVANYISFIEEKAPLYRIAATLDKNIGSLDEYRELMDQFYECSLERDKAFIKNIKFTDHDRSNSIIITGGFHTENLRELFKNEKVSYISIMPKFKNEKGYESPYMKRLAGQRTALENVIDTAIPAVLNLQVVEILSTQLALKVEGEASLEKFRLAVAIVAALMQGKKFILKINADVPVAGMDDKTEKFITFSKPEGADAINHSITPASKMADQAREQFDAVLTAIGTNTFEFKLVSARQQVPVAEPAPEKVSVVSAPQALPAAKPLEGDTEFMQNIHKLTGPLRQGVFNIFMVKARPETIAGQTTIGREASNIFEKKFGTTIVVLYYIDSKGLEAQMGRMEEIIKENEENHPMAFANCMNQEEFVVLQNFVEKNDALKEIVAIGKDFREGEKEFSIPDEAKIIVVGSAIMNDRRLSKTFNMKPEDLYESRMEMLSFLNANGVIDNKDFESIKSLNLAGAEELNKFMEKIWRGAVSLHCTRVNWEKLDDWKNSQRQLLQSV